MYIVKTTDNCPLSVQLQRRFSGKPGKLKEQSKNQPCSLKVMDTSNTALKKQRAHELSGRAPQLSHPERILQATEQPEGCAGSFHKLPPIPG